jgi:hypothetical protein
VAGTDLWTLETVTVPTSEHKIESQFRALTTLAEERLQPTIEEIYDVLCSAGEEEGSYRAVDDQARKKLGRFYETLEAADAGDHPRLRWLVKSVLNAVKKDLGRLRKLRSPRQQMRFADDSYSENVLADATGCLVAPAVAVTKRHEPLGYQPDADILENLEDESRVMIRTGGLIAEFFATEVGASSTYVSLDYAPPLSSLWKAYELELNLSLIQVARQTRGISMPDFFALYEPLFGAIKVPVRFDGQNARVNINRQDLESIGRRGQKALMLAAALGVVDAMTLDGTFNDLIFRYLGRSLPDDFKANADRILALRNQGSHRPLDETSYNEFLSMDLNRNDLALLSKIKRKVKERYFAAPD